MAERKVAMGKQRRKMSPMTCSELSIWTVCAIALQIFGLSLFVFGFFPVKPALSGVSGPESYQPPGNESVDEYNVTAMSPDELRSLYLELSQVPPSYSRLILMVVDGLPAEFVLGKDGDPPSRNHVDAMPYTQSLLASGKAIGYHAKAAPPTVTMPRLKAMVSGAVGGFLDVVFNFNTQAFLDDNLLDQFLRVGWQMTMFGDETWLKLFPRVFTRQDGVSSFFVKDTVQVDLNVSRHLPEELKQDDWHLLILHYLGLDHVGHVGGRKSALMAPKLREMDEVIKMVHLNNILSQGSKKGETLLLVVSDHGMTDSGNHGGSSYEETDSLALFIGPKFETHNQALTTQNTANQVDITPTLAILFGVPIPKNNVGVLAVDCFQSLTDVQKLRALELNSWQLLRLLKAQLPRLSCGDPGSGGHTDDDCSKVSHCNGTAEKRFCCLYSKAAVLHGLWKSMSSSADSGHYYNCTTAAFYEFLTAASGWLTQKVTDKPVGQLAVGIVAMLLACAVLLRLLFCLRQEGYVKGNQGLSAMNIVQNWSLEEAFVVAVIIILVISMGSSSMVEEEQYIWHFLTTTLFWILFRKTMQLLPLGDQDSLDRGRCSPRYKQVLALLVIVVSGRIIRAWHQGGVNWTQLPDISKWLEQAGTRWIKAIKVLSGILITSLSLFAFSKSRLNRCFILIVQLFFLLSGCLLLQHAIKYQDKNFLASGGDATFIAQIIYGVLGIATCFIAVASPWMFPLYISVKSSSNGQSPGSQIAENQMIHLLGGLKESSYLTGWAYLLSWSLLQLLLQQPINSMPILLLLLQISASVIYFLNDRVARKTWVEVAALYFIGMAGHFGLGNTNTLATIDVAGAFIGISSHSTLLSGILMFCITYASPMLVLLSLVMYISIEDESHSRGNNTTDIGLLLKAVLVMPLLVPLCINSVLLIAYTIILLQMRNHLFIWSVFSPKYLYVCAATVCVYIGVCIVAATEAYLYLVCSFRSRRLVVRTFTNKVTGANRQ